MKIPKLKKESWKEYAFVSVLTLIVLVLLLAVTDASATGRHDININIDNYHEHENDTTGCMCVSGGVSDSDLSKGLSLAMTAGAHEMDWGTTDWQASVTYALQVNEDDEGAYSAKLGKKWAEIPALFHVTFVPEQGQNYGDWVIVGGTVRF